MSRNTKGILSWSVLTAVLIVAYTFINKGAQAVVVPMATCLCAMVGREVWQYKTGQATVFEWDDIALYSAIIVTSSVVCGLTLVMFGVIE